MPIHRSMELLTPSGYKQIQNLLGKCTIWTGEEWSDVIIEKSNIESKLHSVCYYGAPPSIYGDDGIWETKIAKDFYLLKCKDESFKSLEKAIHHRSRSYIWGSPIENEKTYTKLLTSKEWQGSQTAYNVVSDKPFVVDCLVLKNKEV